MIAAALRSAVAVDVVAAGKAAGPMLHTFAADAGVSLRRVIGVAPEPSSIDLRASVSPWAVAPTWHRAAHPIPDESSVAAARIVMDLAAATAEGDLSVLLLSGGASSLMALPADGVTLADKQRTSRLLLEQGVAIRELNTVRKHLSAIKGGQLAAAASGSVLTLTVSDVVGDDLSTIASGPTVPDATTFDMALDVMDQYGGRARYPAPCVARLERGAAGVIPETPKPGDPRLARSTARIIGGRHTAMEGARAAAEALGYSVHVIDAPTIGEARVASGALIAAARAYVASGFSRKPVCIVASGETTVRVTGAGKGGRNQECALAMAGSLETLGGTVVAASVGTDGIDGPTDAAGGVVDSTTLARAAVARIGPPQGYLDDNNAYVFFNELNDLIRIGPTSTNVGDLQVILVGRW